MSTATPAEAGPQQDRPHVLVADDQPDVVRALRLLLRGEGFRVDSAVSPAEVLEAVAERHYDVALIDLNYTRDTTSGSEGLELIDKLRALDPDCPVVVMTAWSTVELAVDALHRGAADFVEKPWKNQRLLSILRSQAALGAALKEQKRLRADRRRRDQDDCEPLVAESDALKQVLDVVARVAVSDANILITGDNGTGKGLIARHIHRRSRRADGPFVVVNMGGLPSGVFESEMFGHVKGAFTDARSERIGRFELADGGTLLLDEIGNLPLDQQAKLLHVIETGRVEPVGASRSRATDVRLIAATNTDLKRQVADGAFRKDLYFRLNTVEIHIPPLAERRTDIEPLAEHFLIRHRRRYARPDLALSDRARALLERYPWPGNVREIDHVIERAVLLARGEAIEAADLQLEPDGGALAGELPLMTLAQAEEALLRTALQTHRGNVIAAAQALGISRSALYRRMEKFGIER